MIIEHYKPGKTQVIYQRFEEKGRMLPQGIKFAGSWINEDVSVCYQVMEAEAPELLKTWINIWQDLIEFEVIPVISSIEAKKRVMGS